MLEGATPLPAFSLNSKLVRIANMAKYHINPETGNPGICRAKQKCPYGSLETEHYSTLEEARQVYEELQTSQIAESSRIYTPEEVEEFVLNSPDTTFLVQEVWHSSKGSQTIAVNQIGEVVGEAKGIRSFSQLESQGWERDGDPQDPRIQALVRHLEEELPLKVTLSQHFGGKHISVDAIIIDPSSRQGGVGTDAMNRIITVADVQGWTLSLSPSTDFGASSKGRLEKFYKRFGFKPNKGRVQDFTISDAMLRLPQERLTSSPLI
jgi:GNAT superfamily N-acetyltransferase